MVETSESAHAGAGWRTGHAVHLLVWLVLPPTLFAAVVILQLTAPEALPPLFRSDHEGGGLIETMTVLALVPAIAAGVVLLTAYRDALPDRRTWIWFLLWTLCAVYFAGEEVSWGQWLFGWETPDWMKDVNQQDETNLHNIDPWLDRKPRQLIEIWIAFMGLVVPAILLLAPRHRPPRGSWLSWIVPPAVCLPAALAYVLVRIARVNDAEWLGHTELREYQIALFFCNYLLACAIRAAAERDAGLSRARRAAA